MLGGTEGMEGAGTNDVADRIADRVAGSTADGQTVCDDCGFDCSRWSQSDLTRTRAHGEDLARCVVDGLSVEQLAGSPAFVPLDQSGDDLVDAAHAIMHYVDALARFRRVTDPFEPMNGVVTGLFSSTGGVPKTSIPEAVIGVDGVEGDTQSDRAHHGRPWQALCLYNTEVIDALRAEGHSITPGAAGENITLGGLDWSRLRGGLTIEVGEIRCRVTAPAIPCHKIGPNFADGNSTRINNELHPGWSRWYAAVLRPGTVRNGDSVVISA